MRMPILSWQSIAASLKQVHGEGAVQGVAGEALGNAGCLGQLAARGLLKPGCNLPAAECPR